MKPNLIESILLPLSDIDENTGQIPGVPRNPRKISDEKFEALKKSISDDPELLSVNEIKVFPFEGRWVAIGGNMRRRALIELGYTEAVCKPIPENWSAEKLRAEVMKDNYGYGEYDQQILHDEWDLEELEDWDMDDILMFDLDEDESEEEEGVEPLPIETPERDKKKGSLKDRFIVAPFSIFDTRKSEWQNRKRMWIDLGLKSEIGRDSGLTFGKDHQPPVYYDLKNAMRERTGVNPTHEEVMKEAELRGIKMMNCTSIFDPVLCEIMYRWFCGSGGRIIDPFCGGSVRGIVAGACGYEYHGNDLRDEQVLANYDNLAELESIIKVSPKWYSGDSVRIDEIINETDFDLLFSCPPYADLEVYSDKEEDLSNMKYDDFISAYREIIRKSCKKLKDDRFAVFVVGEVRDKTNGNYRNFVSDTIKAFVDSGLSYYNHIILVNSVASAAITAGSLFDKSRKVTKIHQDILVFFKGNSKNIKNVYSPLNIQQDIDEIVANSKEE